MAQELSYKNTMRLAAMGIFGLVGTVVGLGWRVSFGLVEHDNGSLLGALVGLIIGVVVGNLVLEYQFWRMPPLPKDPWKYDTIAEEEEDERLMAIVRSTEFPVDLQKLSTASDLEASFKLAVQRYREALGNTERGRVFIQVIVTDGLELRKGIAETRRVDLKQCQVGENTVDTDKVEISGE